MLWIWSVRMGLVGGTVRREGTEKVSPLRLYSTLLNKKADCIKHYVGFAICF